MKRGVIPLNTFCQVVSEGEARGREKQPLCPPVRLSPKELHSGKGELTCSKNVVTSAPKVNELLWYR